MKVFEKLKGFVLLVCCWLATGAWSQTADCSQDNTQNNWYFGNSAQAIRFSRSDHSASLVNNHAVPFGTGGSAVASNPTNGNILFYTDGLRVFDASHAQMPGGTGLNGNPSANQSAVIAPVPGQPDHYYIFTTSAAGNVEFSIVDMTAFGNSVFPAPPLGDVTVTNQATGLSNRSGAMLVISATDGSGDFWLITQENNTDNYTVTRISAGGVFTHTTFSGLTGFSISAADFSYHAETGKIAVTPNDANRNVVILDFDAATGSLTFDQFVLNSATATPGGIYDTEWSPSGQYLYISRLNDSGTDAQILQYDVTNPLATLAPVLPASVYRSYGIQVAPDGSIYHIYQSSSGGPFLVGKLTDPDSVAGNVNYTASAFPGNPNFNGTQFSSFAPSSAAGNLSVSFTSQGTCLNTPISFYPTVSPAADSLVWDFGDGTVSSEWSPVHTYQDGVSYTVTVTAWLNCETATGSGTVNLTPFDLQINLVQDTTACSCELPFPKAPDPPPPCGSFSVTAQINGTPTSMQWFGPSGLLAGQTTATLTPDSVGYYYLVVQDASGCSAYAGVNIKEYDVIDQRANIWYFGQNAGIDFNNQPAVAISGPVNSPEGTATISDRNGQVVLSTDGVRVYDRNGNEITTTVSGDPIPVPPGIGGESGATQSSIIVPVPGDETLYYIFTTQEVHGSGTYEVRYTLYDLKANNGNGGIVEYNQLLFAKSTERIISDGNWIIIHEYGNNSFRAYPITPTGIGNPVISSVGSDHVVTSAENGQGYMKLGPNGKLAVALSTPGVSNVIELFDFDPATGMITNYQQIDTGMPNGQIYGIEFAGNKMFVTITGNPSTILEYYFDYQGNPVLITPSLPPINAELGAIQVGPDGQIYVAVNGASSLGIIQFNPDTLQVSQFTLNGFPLAGGTQSTLGLPNFIQNIGVVPQQAGMEIVGLCEGEPTFFTGFGTDSIDEFFWQFGDGFTSTDAQTEHTYPVVGSPTTYTVRLRVFNRCGFDTLIIQDITIYPPPEDPTFLPAGVLLPNICENELILEATPPPGPPNYTYLWSTGETEREISVSQRSIISVTITDNISGCTSSGSILVADNRPVVDLGPDLTICQYTPVAPLNAGSTVYEYRWTINGAQGSTSESQSVDTNFPDVFEYIVEVKDDDLQCTSRDTVVLTINESPVFTAVPTGPTTCGAGDGFIDLTIVSPVANLFSYTVTGPSTTAQDIDRTAGLYNIPNLEAGAYAVVVFDQITGCAVIDVVNVNDNDFNIDLIEKENNCNPVNLVVTHSPHTTEPFTYRVIDNTTGQVVSSIVTPISGSPFTIPGINAGDYTVEMTLGGCVKSAAATVSQDPTVDVTDFITNPCTNPITIEANGITGGDGSFTWSGPGTIANPNTNPVSVTNAPQGQQIYNVILGASAGFCPLDTFATVFVNNNVVVDFTQSDACADQVTLTSTITPMGGNYIYRWYRIPPNTPIAGGQNFIIGASDNGVSYRVEVVNTVSGCAFQSDPHQVFVNGELQLSMTTTPPCQGSTFTLTATSNIPGTAFLWAFNGTTVPGGTQPTLDATAAGTYRVTGSLPGCSRFIENQVTLLPSTPGSLPQRALICPDPGNPDPNTRQVTLDAGPDFTSYEWFVNGISQSIFTRTFIADEAGVYSVNLINNSGCPSSDETIVVEECRPRLVAPNAFRPGSGVTNPGDPDRSNSDFWVLPLFIDDDGFQIFIFNRWGELVFQSSDSNFRWNGGYNNNLAQLLPAGTYSYVVKYKSIYRPQDGVQEKRGGVVLVR